jgi:APA family basic amino acid/polyamine antiporter
MPETQAPKGEQLQRVLGPWVATALVIGTVIGSGVFKKPQAVARDVPEFGLAMLAWVLVGVLTLFGSLTLAEVAVIHPRAGGNYAFLREAYGRWAGFLWGWVEFWIIRSASIAALATIFTESLHDILRQSRGLDAGQQLLGFWTLQAITVTVIAVLAFVNARGTMLGGGLQFVVTSVKVVSLLAIALLPYCILAFVSEPLTRPSFDNVQAAWPADWSAVNWSKFGAALIAVFWSYHGWMNIAPVAEEVRDPQRNLPLALLLGTTSILVLYLSVNFAYHLVVPSDVMVHLAGRTVAGEFAVRLLGPVGLLLASTAVMISVFGSLNGNLLVGPRLLFAMGQDGLAPQALSKVDPVWKTPARAEAVLAAWTILLVLAVAALLEFQVLDRNANQFDTLTDYAMFGAISFETLAVASIFVLRRRYPVDKVKIAYRCWGYPVIPIIYVAAMAAVLGNMFFTKPNESYAALGFIGAGALVYAVFFAGTKSPMQRTDEVDRQTRG